MVLNVMYDNVLRSFSLVLSLVLLYFMMVKVPLGGYKHKAVTY